MIANTKNFNLNKFPTLEQVLLVEEKIQNSSRSIITYKELKKELNNQVNRNILLMILDYLETINKITVSSKGITWIQNTNSRLRKAIEKGLCI